MRDLYDLVLSPEVRDYMREHCELDFEEKCRMINTSCCSLEEKYRMLQELLGETKGKKHRELLSQVIKVYDWAFTELREEGPGQIYIYMGYCDTDPGERDFNWDFEAPFHRYEELVSYVEKEEEVQFTTESFSFLGNPVGPDEISLLGAVEKYADVDGQMKCIFTIKLLRFSDGNGNEFTYLWQLESDHLMSPFRDDRKYAQQLGITEDALDLFESSSYRSMVYPFGMGDLVCLKLPCWSEPLYGVLQTYDDGSTYYMNLFYIKDDLQLGNISLSYGDVGMVSGWPVKHWLYRAEPSQLPAGQELLADISAHLHRLNCLDPKAALNWTYSLDKSIRDTKRGFATDPTPMTMEVLLRFLDEDKRNVKAQEEEKRLKK